MKAHPCTPAVPSPRFGADDNIEEISSEIESATRGDQAWLKTVCLNRDGKKCIISGLYDINEWLKFPVNERPNVGTARTELAHIIPFSLGSFSEVQVSQTVARYTKCRQATKCAKIRIALEYIDSVGWFIQVLSVNTS